MRVESRRFLGLAAGVGASVIAACGGGTPVTTETATDGGTIPTAVDAVLRAKCQACHSNPPHGGAPFPLVKFEDVHAPFATTATPIYQEMHALIQPNGVPHMPYGNAPALTPDEFSTLDAWLVAGAPGN